jgi:hypothetical protein
MVEHVWTVFDQITLEMYLSFLDLYRLRCRTLLHELFVLDHMVHGKFFSSSISLFFSSKYLLDPTDVHTVSHPSVVVLQLVLEPVHSVVHLVLLVVLSVVFSV